MGKGSSYKTKIFFYNLIKNKFINECIAKNNVNVMCKIILKQRKKSISELLILVSNSLQKS